jgi:hypothetical protein
MGKSLGCGLTLTDEPKQKMGRRAPLTVTGLHSADMNSGVCERRTGSACGSRDADSRAENGKQPAGSQRESKKSPWARRPDLSLRTGVRKNEARAERADARTNRQRRSGRRIERLR